jgi:hypothetical protein
LLAACYAISAGCARVVSSFIACLRLRPLIARSWVYSPVVG